MQTKIANRVVSVDPGIVWAAIKHEFARQSTPLRRWLAFLGCLIAFGACGAIAAIAPGAKGFGTTPAFEWGLLIAAYVFFAVTTSGLCLASSLGTVFGIQMFMPLERRHAILAVLFLVAGFGIIALDLHYPIRLMFGVAMSPSPRSAMWWMGVLYAIYLGFLLTEVWSMFTGHPRIHRAACVLSTVMAVAAPSTLGAVFGVLVARPFWHGAFVPAYFLVTAFLSGTALLGIVFVLVNRLGLRGHGPDTDRVIPALGILLALALAGTLFLTAWQTIVDLYGGVPGLSKAVEALVVGPLALRFWVVRVLLGLLVPLVVLVRTRPATGLDVLVASCLAFVGIFADRIGFVTAGQVVPGSAASGVVSQPLAEYAPSLVEISIVVGALGLVGFLYTLAERFLDLAQPAGRHGAGDHARSQGGVETSTHEWAGVL
jgi:molybdopterin-containing oxidoreductase family membrane subunit